MGEEKLLTVKDVAAMLQVEEHTVYRLCDAKRVKNPIVHVSIGGSYKTIRFYRDDVEAWLVSCRVGEEVVPRLRHVKPQARQIVPVAPRRDGRNVEAT